MGAWVVHHGRKVAADLRGPAEYSAIDLAAKAASLLARLAETSQATLTNDQVLAVARMDGVNPKTELEVCLSQLEQKRLIDRSETGLSVLGVTGRTALGHAADLFEDNDPQPIERAALDLAELASKSPVPERRASEFISDTYKLKRDDTADFLQQASEIGFVDAEGDVSERLLFNGNLFRRDAVEKTNKVLESLDAREQSKLCEFDELLRQRGSVIASAAEALLGAGLLAKLKAAALYDMNVVSNEAGDHVFITSPGAFHKFISPLVDDAFDHAKALVSALSYGMSLSSAGRGEIWGIDLLLGKMIRGGTVGPKLAIGYDYRALELERVVQIINTPNGYYMRLLKREVGEIALQVLHGGNAASRNSGDAAKCWHEELHSTRVGPCSVPEDAEPREQSADPITPRRG